MFNFIKYKFRHKLGINIKNLYTLKEVKLSYMNSNEFDIPEEINVHKQIWGKDADEVIYGRGEIAEDDDDYRCPICISRIDEFGYCACGGNLGVS